MKRLGITQRVATIESHGERRDCLDQRWSSLVFELGFIPIPLPNTTPDKVNVLLDSLQLDAILLSGGNSVASLKPIPEDAAPERDAFEYALIETARARKLPLMGVCRGMQVLNLFFGGALSPIEGHVGCRHSVTQTHNLPMPDDVNSSHHYGIQPNELASCLIPIATDKNGCIEGFVHKTEPVTAIMWHPEREMPSRTIDKDILRFAFKEHSRLASCGE